MKGIVFIDPRGMRKYDKSSLFDFKEVQQNGRDKSSKLQKTLDAIIKSQNGDNTCAMLYTSGTTGRPKGVVLSNRNIVETAKATCEFDTLSVNDSVLAYLPMAWVGDFIFSIGQAYTSGFCVACPESGETMQHDLREVGPTYFFAPPRYFESMLTSVQIRMEDAGKFKRWLFKVFMAYAKEVGPKILDGKPIGLYANLKYLLGELLITGPLKNTLGLSRVRVGYTAGEAIGPELFEFYRSLGINLKQFYGQTEASVFITQQNDGEVSADTVGKPSPGVELKIDEKGQVFYRSVGSFVEYYKDKKSTAETKDKEGWVATGDAGFIEKTSGQLRIIDRAKDVGKLKDGSMFAPKFIENKHKFVASILESVVFGDGKDKCNPCKKIKSHNIPLICQIQTLKDAKHAVDIGADIIVAQGAEAGGHGEKRATFTLVPEVADYLATHAPNVLLVAAGGVADGRGLAAGLMLGADGVLVGSRFWAASEALVHPNMWQAGIKATGDDTLRATFADVARDRDWPERYSINLISNEFSDRWHKDEAALATNEKAKQSWRQANLDGDTSIANAFVGEAIGQISSIETAVDIITNMMQEAETLLRNKW